MSRSAFRICRAGPALLSLLLFVCRISASDLSVTQASVPDWAVLVDQATDPQLAGLKLPAGLKLEAVADDSSEPAPATIQGWSYRVQSGRIVRQRSVVQEQVATAGEFQPSGPGAWRQITQPDRTGDLIEQDLLEVIPERLCQVTVGRDGWLYVVVSGVSESSPELRVTVKDAEGRTVVISSGAVLRCRPDGTQLHVFSTGLGMISPAAARSSQSRTKSADVADASPALQFDSVLRPLVVDRVSGPDGRWTARVLPLQAGADFGVRGVVKLTGPGLLTPLAELSTVSFEAWQCCRSGMFPESFDNLVLIPDADGERVVAVSSQMARSGIKPGVFDVIVWRNAGFHPERISQAADGSLLIRSRSAGDKPGRIFRLRPVAAPAVAKSVVALPESLEAVDDAQLSQWLNDASDSTRGLVVKRLTDAPADPARSSRRLVDLLKKSGMNEQARLTLISGLSQVYDQIAQAELINLVTEPDEAGRLAAEVIAARATRETCGAHFETHVARAKIALKNPEPAIRARGAMILGRFAMFAEQIDAEAPRGIARPLIEAAFMDRQQDVRSFDAVVRALESAGEPAIRMVSLPLTLRGSPSVEPALRTLEAMRSSAALQVLDGVLFSNIDHLTADQQRRLTEIWRRATAESAPDIGTLTAWILSAEEEADPELLLSGLETLMLCVEAGCDPGDGDPLMELTSRLLKTTDAKMRQRTLQLWRKTPQRLQQLKRGLDDNRLDEAVREEVRQAVSEPFRP